MMKKNIFKNKILIYNNPSYKYQIRHLIYHKIMILLIINLSRKINLLKRIENNVLLFIKEKEKKIIKKVLVRLIKITKKSKRIKV